MVNRTVQAPAEIGKGIKSHHIDRPFQLDRHMIELPQPDRPNGGNLALERLSQISTADGVTQAQFFKCGTVGGGGVERIPVLEASLMGDHFQRFAV